MELSALDHAVKMWPGSYPGNGRAGSPEELIYSITVNAVSNSEEDYWAIGVHRTPLYTDY
jgi:hypothetical protein